ncbi:MAG: hypothetical protein CMJ49_04210 [Planctomycetaceae bacterium]|nr:hypothetical protein [Planctomycetaceae bacterium]
MNVVLMGYRGCGKSTIGRALADRLGLAFIDVDDEVCRRFNLPTISAIFQAHSEAAFREAETNVVVELVGGDGRVIALGGGSVMHTESRRTIEATTQAMRVYLKCTAEELFRRTQTDPKFSKTRPQQSKLGGSVERITEMLAQREPVYTALADVTIDVTDCPIDQAVETLAEQAGANQ